jgi:hypothetical protein
MRLFPECCKGQPRIGGLQRFHTEFLEGEIEGCELALIVRIKFTPRRNATNIQHERRRRLRSRQRVPRALNKRRQHLLRSAQAEAAHRRCPNPKFPHLLKASE